MTNDGLPEDPKIVQWGFFLKKKSIGENNLELITCLLTTAKLAMVSHWKSMMLISILDWSKWVWSAELLTKRTYYEQAKDESTSDNHVGNEMACIMHGNSQS